MAISAILSSLFLLATPVFSASIHLHLTAVITKEDGAADFECWRITQPFEDYPTVGTAITGLADVSNVSYVVLPPRSEEGLHKPPHPMFFVLLSGLAHVTLPTKPEDEGLYMMEGASSLVIAADYWGEGHFTSYPSDKDTVALQIPFKEGRMPEHEVVAKGVCGAESTDCGIVAGAWAQEVMAQSCEPDQ